MNKESPTVQDPRLTPSFGAPPSAAWVPAVGRGWVTSPSAQNVTGYCLECFGPIYDDGEFCRRHAELAIVICEFCGERPIDIGNGYDACARCVNEGRVW